MQISVSTWSNTGAGLSLTLQDGSHPGAGLYMYSFNVKMHRTGLFDNSGRKPSCRILLQTQSDSPDCNFLVFLKTLITLFECV